jgi:hypothetical protein
MDDILRHRPPEGEEENFLDYIQEGLGHRAGKSFREVREGRAEFNDLSPQTRRRVLDLARKWVKDFRAKRRR